MRPINVHIVNSFCCMATIMFADMPDNGPGSQIAMVLAQNEQSAVSALKQALGPNGIIAKGPIPAPVVTVYDDAGLKSLKSDDFDSWNLIKQ